jgi:formylglycine-generating enzyme required for sulfatase activity
MRPSGPYRLMLACLGLAAILGGTRAGADEQRSKYDGMVQLLVPAGDFTVGADDADAHGRKCEFPPHRVHLPAYWIDKYEVTNAQFVSFLNRGAVRERGQLYSYVDLGNPCCRLEYVAASKTCRVKPGYEQHPVCAVSWAGALAYARSVHRRLPTEAEWERAARGTDGRRYPWGNTWEAGKTNTREGGAGGTVPVGSRPGDRSPCGAMDMAGNVREWVEDAWNEFYYLSSPTDNPVNEENGYQRVVRGGAWCLTEWDARTTSRQSNEAGTQRRYMGFRCAETVPEPLPPPAQVSPDVLFYAPLDGTVAAAFARGERRPQSVPKNLQFVPGRHGQAALLGDVDTLLRFIQYDATDNFHPEEGTISLWIQLHGWTGTDGGYRYFFMIADEATCKFYLYRFDQENLLVLAGNGIEGQWGSIATPTADWKDGQWLHLAVTWKDRRVTLYVDGKVMGETVIPQDKYFRGLPPSFYLGQMANWDPNQKKAYTAFEDFVIFSRALSPKELVQEMNRQGAP